MLTSARPGVSWKGIPLRPARLFFVLLLALALLPLAQALLPAERARRAALAACRAAPTVDCLIEAGFTEAMRIPLPSHLPELDALATLGYGDQARALEIRLLQAQGLSSAEAIGRADRRFAAPLLAFAIRQGQGVETAARGLNSDQLYLAALDLLGQEPYSPKVAQAPGSPDQAATLAGLVETRSRGLSQLANAARLRALLGQPAQALAALRKIEAAELPQLLDPETLRAIGPEALTLCHDETCRDAMRIALDPGDLAALNRAFDRIAAIPPGPDIDRLGRLVARASPEAGLILARGLEVLAEALPGGPAEFPHLTVTKLLLAKGAPPEEVRAALARAEAAMPGGQTARDRETRSARRDLAALHAALGEVGQAAAWITGDRRPFWDWLEVLERPMPDAVVPAVLAEAAKVLEPGQRADLQACAAQARASDGEREWARQTLRAALTQDLGGYGPEGLDCLAKAAGVLHLPVLRHRAGLALARTALDEPTARGLFDAAIALAAPG
ncbi:hypothetical protein [Stagnihabitans tardus]|uniref:Uncharacterized protein n=1 Tax=Stagnihabitans tardus TaxID=2699202 RepID=A0AAE4YFA6_9RHOB|nr:hypothetical protein [Stagnihabitans tardus]NBZ88620.1 hypothetical protein [Stagnihabitans tardus]